MSSLATNIKHFKQRLNDKERDLLAEITRLKGEAHVSAKLKSEILLTTPPPLRAHLNRSKRTPWRANVGTSARRLAPYCLADQEKQEADMLSRTVDSTFHLEARVHESHQKAAEQHELAARAHRTAAEHNEKGDNPTANWHSERALEYAEHAYRLAKDARNKSGQIGSL